ncbi:hypothetical protein [Legionella saoudiensis]|uniref:hypothetical protein n=1 Tax=Legionella saoudiensis TaxID=1750561 RepID=UPI0007306387|nr:hypothetical protein [Legionella saoudiensis]
MKAKFFKNVSRPQPEGKLLITVLASESDNNGKLYIDLPQFTLRHGVNYAETYKNKTSTIYVGDNGSYFDLKETLNEQLIFGNNALEEATEKLRDESLTLSEDEKFDKVLIIGNMLRLSPETANTLKNLYESKVREGGLIRVQICNFCDRRILDANANEGNYFVDEIVPTFCRLSIPDKYSFISDKDTRAIDATVDEKEFNKLKTPINKLLRSSNSEKYIEHGVNTLLKKLNIDNISDISIVELDGQRVPIENSSGLGMRME